MTDEILEMLGIKTRDVTLEEIDIEKSRSEFVKDDNEILVTKDGDIVTFNPYNPQLFQIKPKFGGEIIYVDRETFNELHQAMNESAIASLAEEEREEEKDIDNSYIIHFVKNIMLEAKKRGASDIHIYNIVEKEGKKNKKYTKIDFRIDGQLSNYKKIKGNIGDNIVNKIMNMSSLDTGKKMFPQDGKFKEVIDDSEVEVRVSTAPSINGIVCVMRIAYSSEQVDITLEDIGFEKEVLKRYREIFREPYGMILNVGATGQGKSTTFRLTISELIEYYNYSKKVVTVEDPVEFQIKGAIQHQVNEKMGITFASLLRSLMRQDPDIIMIGEIRDEETAEIGVRASLTGHLVLATLHANDSFDAIIRMKDLGINPQLMTSTLSAVLSQRLARKLCNSCRIEYEIPYNIREKYGLHFDKAYKANPKGCSKCNYTGFKGRTAIIEMLEINDHIKEHMESMNINELKRIAYQNGFNSLWMNGVKKVQRGEISLEELISVVKPDRLLVSSVEKVQTRYILYPERQVKCRLSDIEGVVFDISKKDISIMVTDGDLLETGTEYEVTIEGVDRKIYFIPRSIARLGTNLVYGGVVKGGLSDDILRKIKGKTHDTQ